MYDNVPFAVPRIALGIIKDSGEEYGTCIIFQDPRMLRITWRSENTTGAYESLGRRQRDRHCTLPALKTEGSAVAT